MIRAERVAEIESAAYQAWPARELVEYDGWQLRFADGFSRRGNSVYPARSSTLPYVEKLEWCRKWYRDRSAPLIVRQTPATEPGLDAVLSRAGFTLEGRTVVMVADLSAFRGSVGEIPAIPSLEWWDAAAQLWQIPQPQRPGWRNIIERIDHPTAFIERSASDGAHAAGLAVVVGEWVGLFEVVVRSDRRRRGIGSALARSLLLWGKKVGASRAFLQVVEENHVALACYRKLGFERSYTYWYRRSQT